MAIFDSYDVSEAPTFTKQYRDQPIYALKISITITTTIIFIIIIGHIKIENTLIFGTLIRNGGNIYIGLSAERMSYECLLPAIAFA